LEEASKQRALIMRQSTTTAFPMALGINYLMRYMPQKHWTKIRPDSMAFDWQWIMHFRRGSPIRRAGGIRGAKPLP